MTPEQAHEWIENTIEPRHHECNVIDCGALDNTIATLHTALETLRPQLAEARRLLGDALILLRDSAFEENHQPGDHWTRQGKAVIEIAAFLEGKS